MKKFKLLTVLLATLCFAAMISCEGPAGADGDIGPTGTDGTNGTDGTDGVDGTDGTDGVAGNLSCLICHTQAGMDVIAASYALSGHNAANAVGYAGARNYCYPCHSHEQFTTSLNQTPGGSYPTIVYPTKITCNTCHGNHESLEDDIEAPLRAIGAFDAITDGTAIDFGNSSNLCANCHQSRSDGTSYDKYTSDTSFTRTFTGDDIAAYTTAAVGPAGSATLNGTSDTLTVVFDVPTTHVYISSTHAGPHHGPQTNVLYGIGGYATAAAPTHKNIGCVACHMGEAGTSEGGHSFYANVANCTTCHAGATNFDVNGAQTAFDVDMALIEVALEGVHAIHVADGEVHPTYSSITRDHFQAFWNFMILLEDSSHGVHNPALSDALIADAKTKLGI